MGSEWERGPAIHGGKCVPTPCATCDGRGCAMCGDEGEYPWCALPHANDFLLVSEGGK